MAEDKTTEKTDEQKVEEEEKEQPRYIEDYAVTEKRRFYAVPFFDRKVDVRMRFTTPESTKLDQATLAFQNAAERIDELGHKATEKDFERLTNSLVKLFEEFIRDPEDREWLLGKVLEPEPDSPEFIEPSDILELVYRIRETNKRDNEAALKKA